MFLVDVVRFPLKWETLRGAFFLSLALRPGGDPPGTTPLLGQGSFPKLFSGLSRSAEWNTCRLTFICRTAFPSLSPFFFPINRSPFTAEALSF